MTPADFETAKLLWAWVQARDAFRLCKETADYMVGHSIKRGNELFTALTTCVSVSYGKPFKRSKGVDLSSALIIPDRYRDLHTLLITQRDKHIAHRDAGTFTLGTIARENDVLAIVEGDRLKWGVNELDLKPEGIVMVCELSRLLEEKCIYWSIKFNKRLRLRAMPNGYYRLNVEDPRGEILVPSKIKPRHVSEYKR